MKAPLRWMAEKAIMVLEQYFQNARLWIRAANMQDRSLAVDQDFLRTLLSYKPEHDHNTAWRLFELCRYAVLLGALVRFATVTTDNMLFNHWPVNTQAHHNSSTQMIEWIILACSLLSFAWIELLAAARRYNSFADTSSRNAWIKRIFIAEMVGGSLLYGATCNPYSDVAYFFVLPLSFVAEFLPFRSAVRRLRSLPACIAASCLIANMLAGPKALSPLLLSINVAFTRTVFISLAVIAFLYARRIMKAQQAVTAAMIEAIPDGLAVVSKVDCGVCWTNAVMHGNSFAEAQQASRVSYRGYKLVADQPNAPPGHADPAATEHLGRASRTGIVRVKSPERVNDTNAEIRCFDVYRAALTIADQIVGAIQLARDVTCRDVLADVTKELQAASTEEEVFSLMGQAASALGYKRCRVYWLSSDGSTFVGRHAVGMEGVPFLGFQLPRFGEPYSEETIKSAIPCIYHPGEYDAFCSALLKDPSLPWIEVPVSLGSQIFGKMSLDNKDHPSSERRALAAEIDEHRGVRHTDNLLVLHNISVQAALAVNRMRMRSERADFLAAYVHFSIRQLALLPAAAYQLTLETYTRDPALGRSIYSHVCGIATLLSYHGTMLLNWTHEQAADRPCTFLKQEVVDVIKIAREVSGWFGFTAEAQRTEVAFTTHALEARIDITVLRHIVFVLISNAFDALNATDPVAVRRVVVVSARRVSRSIIEITVQDNGIGLDEVTLQQLFQHRSVRQGSYKLGLGLIIAKQLARAHGGDVIGPQAPSTNGATFSCVLSEEPGT